MGQKEMTKQLDPKTDPLANRTGQLQNGLYRVKKSTNSREKKNVSDQIGRSLENSYFIQDFPVPLCYTDNVKGEGRRPTSPESHYQTRRGQMPLLGMD